MEKSFQKIPFNKIHPHPKLTPEFINSDGIRPDKEIKNKYKKIFEETCYREPLKVASIGEKFYLLTDYELWDSYQRHLNGSLEQKVDTMILPFQGIEEAIELSAHLSIFNQEKKGNVRRLFDIQVLEDCGKTGSEIRRILETSESQKAKERQWERDYRLYKMKEILNRVIGVKGTGSIIDLVRTRNSLDVDFTPSQADQILTKLNNEQKFVQAFLQEFDIYKENLKRNYISRDEITKPIFKWKAYDFKKVLHLAENISLNQSETPLTNRKTREDQRYSPVVDNELGIVKIPEISFSTVTKDIVHGKKMVEAVYFLEQAQQTFMAHIKRVRPRKHGGPWKVEDMKSNHLKLDDYSYFEFIRRDKLLLYANKERLLKSVNLHPGIFGFESSSPDAISTYETAQKQYSYWWEFEFLRKLKMSESEDPKKHPFYIVYNLIKSHLQSLVASSNKYSTVLSFEDFIFSVFTYVFGKLDELDAVSKERLQRLKDYDRNSLGKTYAEIDEILGRDGKVQLTRQQLDSYLYQHNQTLSKEISSLRDELQSFRSFQTDPQTESLSKMLREFEAEHAN